MQIDPVDLSPRDRYLSLCSVVIPRPIGWVSTLSSTGVPNLAPFSYFGAVTSEPPTLMLNIARRRGGVQKDTTVNLLATGEGVVHIPNRALAPQMVQSSADVEAELDEFELAGLERVPSERVKPARLRDCPLAMEVKVVEHRELGRGPVDSFLLEVLLIHVDDAVITEGRPDAALIQAVGRMGGVQNVEASALFDLPRPPRPKR